MVWYLWILLQFNGMGLSSLHSKKDSRFEDSTLAEDKWRTVLCDHHLCLRHIIEHGVYSLVGDVNIFSGFLLLKQRGSVLP